MATTTMRTADSPARVSEPRPEHGPLNLRGVPANLQRDVGCYLLGLWLLRAAVERLSESRHVCQPNPEDPASGCLGCLAVEETSFLRGVLYRLEQFEDALPRRMDLLDEAYRRLNTTLRILLPAGPAAETAAPAD